MRMPKSYKRILNLLRTLQLEEASEPFPQGRWPVRGGKWLTLN